MADAPKLNKEDAAKLAKLALDEIAMMQPHDLNAVREGCMVPSVVQEERVATEAKFGEGSFPEVHEYCLAGIKRAIEKDWVLGPYLNLVLQHLGAGREYTAGYDKEVIGDNDIKIVRNVRAAAEAGLTEYVGADGKVRPLTCAMALDTGATWAAANPDRVNRPSYSEDQLTRMARACYNPAVSGDVTIGETNETMPVQRMGLVAGELIGRQYQLEVDTASTTGAVEDGAGGLPVRVPVPSFAPERPAKQAKTVGG